MQESKSLNHLNNREVATILAALKLFKERTKYSEGNEVLEEFPDFYDSEECPPLSKYELEVLWEKIGEIENF